MLATSHAHIKTMKTATSMLVSGLCCFYMYTANDAATSNNVAKGTTARIVNFSTHDENATIQTKFIVYLSNLSYNNQM